MIILSVDPGTKKSAYVTYDTERRIPLLMGIVPNETLIGLLSKWPGPAPDHLVIEMIGNIGMRVGAEVFETVYWTGKFARQWEISTGKQCYRMNRSKIKAALGVAKGKDGDVRRALVSRFGGEKVAIGTSKKPGRLAGVSTHIWAAIAVAVVWSDLNQTLFGPIVAPAQRACAAPIARALPSGLKLWR